MTLRKPVRAKAKDTSLYARISAPLFSETHIDECRTKLSALTDDEFVLTMRKAVEIGADPLKGDVYLRRRENGVGVMASIAAMRAYAQAQGDYAGDDQTMIIVDVSDATFGLRASAGVSMVVIDPNRIDAKTNPRGIVSCSMGVYRHIKGDWRRHTHTVSWEDYVPMFGGRIASEAWENIPVVMIQKVAEVGALRKAYPALGAVYIEEEMQQADRRDVGEGRFSDAPAVKTPKAIAKVRDPKPRTPKAKATVAPKQDPIPVKSLGIEINVNFLNGAITPVTLAEFYPRVGGFLQDLLDKGHPQKVVAWFEQNARARQDFYQADEMHGHRNAFRLREFEEIAQRRMKAQVEGRAGQRRTRGAPAYTRT